MITSFSTGDTRLWSRDRLNAGLRRTGARVPRSWPSEVGCKHSSSPHARSRAIASRTHRHTCTPRDLWPYVTAMSITNPLKRRRVAHAGAPDQIMTAPAAPEPTPKRMLLFCIPNCLKLRSSCGIDRHACAWCPTDSPTVASNTRDDTFARRSFFSRRGAER